MFSLRRRYNNMANNRNKRNIGGCATSQCLQDKQGRLSSNNQTCYTMKDGDCTIYAGGPGKDLTMVPPPAPQPGGIYHPRTKYLKNPANPNLGGKCCFSDVPPN